MPDPDAFDRFIREQARALRSGDAPAMNRETWDRRRTALHDRMAGALGPTPDKECPLEPRVIGTLRREGYRIEKLVFQSRPGVWVTANAYVPELKEGQKVPAVLAVHGHWAGARRDPVVQARCLGLAKLGFFVLAVDAFGSGERYTVPARGTYHGALYGATLWPAGYTLLGMQVYDNRRAVDYLLSRPEVNGKLGVTGASGGGNQSMYAGALDERLSAVVPVCSVGNYQSYLQAACCVCEVLPGALRFTEEGDVLGLVAPRALLVINASRDAVQFSPAEAEKSIARARDVFKLYGAEAKLRHQVFESSHDYSRPMREAMYGWMTLHLKGEGNGEPIPEPAHQVETAEDLACFPDPKTRPEGFLFPPTFAARAGRDLVTRLDKLVPDHPEMWEATAERFRAALKGVLGELPVVEAPKSTPGVEIESGPIVRAADTVTGEGGLPIATFTYRLKHKKDVPTCLLLHPEGKGASLGLVAFPHLLERYDLLTVDLRATGDAAPKNDAIAGAPDHNSTEHALWIGRPLLGQWVVDVRTLLDWLAAERKQKQVALAGFGAAGLVALAAGALFPDRVSAVVVSGGISTYVCDTVYATGTRMGILAPGILNAVDVPHLAGMIAPRRLTIADAVSPQGRKLGARELSDAFAFTRQVYSATRAAEKLTLVADARWDKVPF